VENDLGFDRRPRRSTEIFQSDFFSRERKPRFFAPQSIGGFMCGFAGLIAWDERHRISRESLPRMSTAIAHRGPDGEGIFFPPDAPNFRRATANRPGPSPPGDPRSRPPRQSALWRRRRPMDRFQRRNLQLSRNPRGAFRDESEPGLAHAMRYRSIARGVRAMGEKCVHRLKWHVRFRNLG